MRRVKAAVLILALAMLAGFTRCDHGAADGVCGELHEGTPGLHGLCVAFCEAQECEATFVEASGELILHRSCGPSNAQIFANYNRQKGEGDPGMPCVNLAPVADAGSDQSGDVLTGDAVILDGSASDDPDGDTLSYHWVLENVPTGSTAELFDATSDAPGFIADVAGAYVARLVVNDGWADSAPDDVMVRVAFPPPVVTIEAPARLSLAIENPVTVTGTVSDPLATITVDGVQTTNDDGDYRADVILPEGLSTVTVMATNETGEDSASVDVILKTLTGPVIEITSHENGFTAGAVWNGRGAPPDRIVAVVSGTVLTADGSPPTVMVNGVAAAIEPSSALPAPPALVSFCELNPQAIVCKLLDVARYSFDATIDLSKGDPEAITVIGMDGAGGSSTRTVQGAADYCRIAEHRETILGSENWPGAADHGHDQESLPALRGRNQSNTCHAIDGCSSGTDPDPFSRRNRPMPNSSLYADYPVTFGFGTIAPSEFFVHGRAPAVSVGCNIHDTCYQTCVPEGERRDAWKNCNAQQYSNHKAECRRAYPSDAACPFGGFFECLAWSAIWATEKATCFTLATGVRSSLILPIAWRAYRNRQELYCQPPIHLDPCPTTHTGDSLCAE